MDKSFNDQELSDIMKEIEALEEEFTAEPASKMETSDVMEELAELAEPVAIPTARKKAADVVSFHKPEAHSVSTAKTSMSFKVQGDLNLELQFEIGGKTVALDVSEAGLTIQMEGAVTFTVPVSSAHSLKKAV